MNDAEAAFKAKLAAGAMVEHADEMTEGYRRELKKMLRVAGDTEFRSVPMLYSYLHVGVPYRYVQPLLSVAQDELGHAHIDYRLLEQLGEDIDALIMERSVDQWAYPYFFDMPIESWSEIAVAEGLGEFAGGLLVRNIYHHTSYAPWRRALAKVDIEENFHVRFGQTLMREMAAGEDSRRQLQETLDWMFPLLVEFMGPPGREVDPQIEYRLKGKKVDDLRQDYLRYAVPFCHELGLCVPVHYEPDLDRFVLDFPFPCKFEPENKRWDFGSSVEWPEVFARWKAHGPMAEEHLRWIRAGRQSVDGWLSRMAAG
ncbi:MAG TPA: Phenylacetic acid catabolic protein [Chloroflexota bacterium]|jgi:ring-1,2-phenylacetyl-CoA epoxidase subunit PaaA